MNTTDYLQLLARQSSLLGVLHNWTSSLTQWLTGYSSDQWRPEG